MKPFFTALELCEAVMFLDKSRPKEFYASLASYCNSKLEREGKRVYQTAGQSEWWNNFTEGDTHTALLINIEEISGLGSLDNNER